jgi:uroporphyrinogen III methyltransferase/synthase
MHPEPKVFLVGAGPGHPGLITLRAVECLARADFILYDRLVSPRLLDHAPPTAERVCVEDLPGCHPERWPHIRQALLDAARTGKCVVRLQGGDPFLFGRGGEEAEALREAGIAYEVVPGVTSGLAAPAFAGIPVTHRLHSSAVAFVTGHEYPDKPDSRLDWSALARFPGTLVIFMGVARLGRIVESLLAHGKDPRTPAAAIHRGSTPVQRTVESTLGELPNAVEAVELKAPSLFVIGEVAALRSRLGWFESRPLFGKRVLVTRPREQCVALCARLESLGAVPSILPLLDIRDPADWTLVDQAIERLGRYQWLVFTSVNGVEYFLRRLRQTGHDLRALGGIRLAAIGPETADALRNYHLEPDLVPAEYSSEGLAAALRERVAGQRVLLARADRGRELLRDELERIAEVDQVAVYRQVDVADGATGIVEQIGRGEIDFVTLTSSNVAKGFAGLLDAAARERIVEGVVRLVAISPVTGSVLREQGLPVAGEATEYTTAGLVHALATLAGGAKGP